MLTREQIEYAAKEMNHPVCSILDKYKVSIIKDEKVYFGDMADDVEAIDFELEPLDLVSIWSKALEMVPDNRYPRYSISKILSASYGAKGLVNVKGFPKQFVQNNKLPGYIEDDKTALLYIRSRLRIPHSSIDEIDFYVDGVRGGPSLIRDLIKKGDEESLRKIKEIEDYEAEHSTKLLSELRENFGTGLGGLRAMIDITLMMKHDKEQIL